MIEISPAAVWIVIGIFALFSTWAVAYLPRMVAPLKSPPSNAQEIEALDLQNKVRQMVIQLCGGVGFLFSVFMALNAQAAANRDLKARYDRETAELFVKAVESKSPEALYALGYVARRDQENYHEVIYRMLASLIQSLSPVACGDSPEARASAAAKVRVAMTLMHERAVIADRGDMKYNIEHACLSGSDLRVEKNEWGRYRGLANIRASGSEMLRIDFTRIELQNAEFLGISAGDWRNPGWAQEPHRYGLQDLDAQGNPMWRAQRRMYVAHFIDANLTGAQFDGAGLEGADFSGAKLADVSFKGANISRASFPGAQDLRPEQLLSACAGNLGDPQSRQRDKPVVEEPLRNELERAGGVPAREAGMGAYAVAQRPWSDLASSGRGTYVSLPEIQSG